ncbi:MarR family winged helix-turn-helix transcriptional regulator [Streptomyces sp. NPDC048111]|uniref:MarR family winged helix-turn-helix transcriptional regulator n=1 Tax=Streptomyces sp. NPDC048111 TaxID=3365500 RepID=UPI0037202A45
MTSTGYFGPSHLAGLAGRATARRRPLTDWTLSIGARPPPGGYRPSVGHGPDRAGPWSRTRQGRDHGRSPPRPAGSGRPYSVDRLEKQGWVVRRPNPSDRRSSLLALTDDGSRLVDAAATTFAEGLAALIGDTLTGSSGSAAIEAIGRLRTVLEERQIGMPTG